MSLGDQYKRGRRPHRQPGWRVALLAVGVALTAIPAAGQVLRQAGPVLGPVSALGRSAVGDLQRDASVVLSPTGLADIRLDRLRARISRNSRVLEADDHGQPVVRGVVVALSPSPAAIAQAVSAGFVVADRIEMGEESGDLVILHTPEGMSAREAVKRLRKADPEGRYDFDHLYEQSGAVVAGAAFRGAPPTTDGGGHGGPMALGLIDGGVDAPHPVFAHVKIEQKAFAPGGLHPSAHGTAVASLMVGDAGAFHSAASGARLLAADVYGDTPAGGSVEAIVRAMAWMAADRTPVVNVSLVGPRNIALEAAVKMLLARGQVVVAAVGNDGPAAPPLYPASYPGVIAVTGVDGARRVLPEAGRSAHLDFAAPGASMAAADVRGGYAEVRGTSFAAPIVAGRIARALSDTDRPEATTAIDRVAVAAEHPRGSERTYGRGLVGWADRVAPTVVHARPPAP